MFQRFKSALDKSIAEEQARQKTLAEQRSNTASPSSSSRPQSVSRTNSSAAKRKTKKPSQDVSNGSDNLPNTDPAVFEAAFALDDEEAEAKAAVAKPENGEVSEKDVKGDDSADGKTEAKEATENEKTETNGDDRKKAAAPAKAAELPAEIQAKLRKLDKLEKTYPELLRSYRIAHGRATAIEPFERALREHTPLTSIKDTEALVEYLNQLNLKGDMVMDEFKRVSAEKDTLKKKHDETTQELTALKEEMATLKAAAPPAPSAEKSDTTKTEEGDASKKEAVSEEPAQAVKSPVTSILGVFSPKQKPQTTEQDNKDVSEDMFSYDDEIPQLQAEVASKTEEITKLKSEVRNLKDEMAVAKENSAELVENLERATRELSESRDKTAVDNSLQTQLDARNVEIASLTEKLEAAQTKLRDIETTLEKEKTSAAEAGKKHEAEAKSAGEEKSKLSAELKKSTESYASLEKKIKDLTTEIDAMKKAKSESLAKVEELEKQLNEAIQAKSTTPAAAPASAPAAAKLEVPATSGMTASQKKKNNKKKKKGGAAANAAATEATPSETSEAPPLSPMESPDTAALREELAKLKEDISEKDTRIEKLSKQRKTEEDLREEVENMQENLLHIGQDHVEAKERIKELESEKKTLLSRIRELEAEIASGASKSESNSKLEAEYKVMKDEYDELKTKSQTLTSDLGAAQQLAQSRYKDLTDLREVLSKAQPELKSLRQDSALLKTTKEELAAKQTEIRNLEKRENQLKAEVARVQRVGSDREGEVRNLNDRLAAEVKTRARLEDEKRVAGRDFRRSEAEKVELSAKAEKATRDLESLQTELAAVRPKIKALEDDVEALQKERDSLKEEVDLKTAQYNSCQGLLGSMRDQTAELSVQLKEARGSAESLEEELAEVQKHLQERTREGESMRRMINEVDERADAKVRDLRARMEAAVEERDRIEDESATLGRKRARENEELRVRTRELERDVKALAAEKEALETQNGEWRRRREELELGEQKAAAEVDEMRSVVGNLRTALDASEGQVREAEKQRADLRKLLDEARGRYDKLQKELKTVQGKLVAAPSATTGSRSSMDSTRSGSTGAAAQGPDTMYLKTIMLQFLEVKDEKVRGQLVPVLGKLLKFDRNDEQKWMSAVHNLGKPGR
ncbi:uncharacterized protein PG998_012155 [Apiospora kogelbergensis]|uniref:uncharacterized protein n=1 Tax=Apiospora kogelbergensis TaxID=1337665 RepID=UPI00312ECA32